MKCFLDTINIIKGFQIRYLFVPILLCFLLFVLLKKIDGDWSLKPEQYQNLEVPKDSELVKKRTISKDESWSSTQSVIPNLKMLNDSKHLKKGIVLNDEGWSTTQPVLQYQKTSYVSKYSNLKKALVSRGEKWSSIFDTQKWNIVTAPIHPKKRIVPKEFVLEGIFVCVKSGIVGTNSKLHVSNSKDKIYRFSFVPSKEGKSSRLEITTCFTQDKDLDEKFNNIPRDSEWLVKTTCPVVKNSSTKDFHTYSYEVYFPRKDFNKKGKYILTQWHGTPDPTRLKDQNGCIGQISLENLDKVCRKEFCKEGKIYNWNKTYTGLQYCQAGYPPLTFSISEEHFRIVARSDEKMFMDKGGCGSQTTICQDHPKTQFHAIWKIPVKYFKFDSWVKFKWEIKWSEYFSTNDKVPGIRTTDAYIKVWMNNEIIVDWIGPCGRNDNGRPPYFKIGIYNPSGSTPPIRMFFRQYRHHHQPMETHENEEFRRIAELLHINDARESVLNQYVLCNSTTHNFGLLSSVSKNSCRFQSKSVRDQEVCKK